MRALKNIAWMLAAGPIMIVTTLIVLVVGALYLALGLVALCFFFWMCFWGLHWLYSHEIQSAIYCAESFAAGAAAASLITLMTFGLGAGTKGTVNGLASRKTQEPQHSPEHPPERPRRRIQVAVPMLRPKPKAPVLRVVN